MNRRYSHGVRGLFEMAADGFLILAAVLFAMTAVAAAVHVHRHTAELGAK